MTQQPTITIGRDGDGDPVELDPSAIVSTRLMIQADSRQGKTSLLRLIAEGLLAQDRQVIVLDVEGEFATLRECGDVLVLGGDYGEAPIVPAAASKIGELLASTTASAVLDLLTMDPEYRDQFVGQLLDYWVRMPQKFWRPSSPRILLVDEVQELAPQSGKSESRPVIDKAMRLLAKRGFGVVPATQRLSSTSKGVVNVCRSNAVGPIAPKDAKDAADVLGIESRERHELVRQEVGTFTVRGAVFGHAEPVQVQVNRPQTSPPDPGDAPVAKARRGGIGKLVKAMKALQTKAEAVDAGDEDAETIDGLKAQIVKLRGELAQRPAHQADPAAQALAIRQAVADAKAEARRGARSLVDAIREQAEHLATDAESLAASCRGALGILETKGDGPDVQTAPTKPAPKPDLPTATPPAKPRRGSQDLPQLVLDAYAWWYTIGEQQPTRSMIAWRCGYKNPDTSTFRKAVYELRDGGLWDAEALTDAGTAAANWPSRPGTMTEHHGLLQQHITGREGDILRHAIQMGPSGSFTREQAAGWLGYSNPDTSTFRKALYELRDRGLLNIPPQGAITPTALLFPESLR